jgi:hypothetical protein
MSSALFLSSPARKSMNDARKPRQYAAASAPDIVARLRHAIEANETARILVAANCGAAIHALTLHLEQID